MSEPVKLPDVLEDALTRCIDDTSAPFADHALDEATKLAMSEDVRPYQRYMTECKELGVAMADLKKEIKKRIEEAQQAELASEREPSVDASPLHAHFVSRPSGMHQRIETARGGRRIVRLSNFSARITVETVIDDGVEERRSYEIEALVKGERLTVRIPAAEFAALSWVATRLGARAIVMPGPGMRDAFRAAIQIYSLDRRLRRAYGHTGWRLLEDGAWAYLHAGGAVIAESLAEPTVTGAKNPVTVPTITDSVTSEPAPITTGVSANTTIITPPTTTDSAPAPAPKIDVGQYLRPKEPRVTVDLPSQLSRYELPEPPVGDARKASIQAVMRMIRLLPRVMFPLVAFAFRTALSSLDFVAWLAGPTGCFKSEVATLILQLWGKRFDSRHLPLCWNASVTAIETVLFHAKDVVVVIDEFVPRGSAMERDRMHAQAGRVVQSLGNGSTRSRGRADGGLRADHPPRASVIVTGEERPRGHSTQARCLIVELTHGEISSAELSMRQAEGASGLYSQAMSGFVHAIGQRLVAGSPPRVIERARELRDQATATEMHRRTPGIAADLGVGLELLLEYAVECGAITATEKDALWREGWGAIGVAAASQADHHIEEEPATMFLRLLASAVATGRAHLCGMSGSEPADSRRWGWRPVQVGDKETMRPGGDQIGWLELGARAVYLDADASFRVAQNYSHDHGLVVTPMTLRKRMHERGLLASVEKRGGKTHFQVRRDVSGARREVLHVKWPGLSGADEPSKVAPSETPTPVEVADITPPEPMQGDLFEAAEGGS